MPEVGDFSVMPSLSATEHSELAEKCNPVLVTGATGYIGSRLVPALIAAGHSVRVLVRSRSSLRQHPWAKEVQAVEGDIADHAAAAEALQGVKIAYYLVHSMAAGPRFADLDARAARSFIAGAGGIEHVIYLGGLVPAEMDTALSEHLSSRQEVGQMLRDSLPVTEFRAGPVIGAGSASFEMVRHLTDKLPVMVAPRWISNLIQCIGIDDMLAYLIEAVDAGPAGIVEVGSDRITFRQMMLTYAAVRGLKRVIIPVPVLTPGLAAEWIQFVTPISRNLAVPIVKGMIKSLVADTAKAEMLFPQVRPASFRSCVEHALGMSRAALDETLAV
jgi:uncharacterized protein YbjT (DUF2867 family)